MRACLHRSSFRAVSALILPSIVFAIASAPLAYAGDIGKSPTGKIAKTSKPPFLGAVGPFSDVPLAIEPRCQRDEAGRDRLHALALFSTGRALEQKKNLPAALRRYERAQRYDPDSRTIVQAVVDLAGRLGRIDESDRYLRRLVELGGGDPIEVEELAFRTAMGGEFERSIAIYRRLLDSRKGGPNEPIDVVMRWRLSEIYYMTGKYKEAADCAVWVIEALDNPKKFGLDEKLVAHLLEGPHLPHALFGEYFLQADRVEQAKAMFEKANEVAPDKNLLEYRLARLDVRAGRNEQALRRLESCLGRPVKIAPNSNKEKDEVNDEGTLQDEGLAPYELLGKVLEALGKKNELIPRLEKLYVASSKDIVAGYALADAYRKSAKPEKGNLEKAEKLYKSLLVQQPSAVGYAGLMEIYRAWDRMGPLLELLGQAAEQTASLEPIGALVREVSDQSDKNGQQPLLERLAKAARQLEKKRPKSSAAGACLAVALLALDAKRYDLAEEFFRKAIKANPQEATDLIMIWSVGLLADDRNAQAAEVLRSGFKQKLFAEDDPIPYFYLATALAMVNKNKEAIAAAEKVVALRSDSPRFAAQQGWVLYRAKQYDRAAQVNENILKRFDTEQKDQGLRETLRGVRLTLAGIEVNRGNASRSEELLEEVLDEFPDDISAMNDLGFLWADENRHLQRALRMTRKVVEADPENAAYRDSLGWALFRLGKHKQAVVELEKAIAIDPKEPEILEHLGKVYDCLKEHQKAEDCRQRAVDLKRD